MTTHRPFRIVVADQDRCPGSREDSNYFEWIVTDRDLNLFGQCIACGQDIRLETNLWHYYILAEHEATRPGDLTSIPCQACGRLTFAGRICCTAARS